MLALLLTLASFAGPQQSAPDRLYDADASQGRTAFFAALAAGDYGSLDPILLTLEAEADAGDDASRAVLGFAHSWKLSEFARAPVQGVQEHARLAVEAFDLATDAHPDDPRLEGFRGAFLMAQGSIEDQPALLRKGWFATGRSIRGWPEWALFTRSYGLVGFDPDHRRYQQAIEMMWRTLDECATQPVARSQLDWSVLNGSIDTTDPLKVRACMNTDVVPYNIEGFFLVFGDLYARAGQLENAQMMYDNALAMDAEGTWPYRWVAEERVASMSALPDRFADQPAALPSTDPSEHLIFGGPASCTVCHQAE